MIASHDIFDLVLWGVKTLPIVLKGYKFTAALWKEVFSSYAF